MEETDIKSLIMKIINYNCDKCYETKVLDAVTIHYMKALAPGVEGESQSAALRK